ncbi:hypothetical protein [Psittacicella gerlachiana]|uniref:Uncharacterized protein n=1 Tax=Psittacicella gerlachiana TaxID=2028574 RepID=A0A3A1YFF6_9GAMM|nr:hypothetical protein [Psittacicella gerlachiana]RIY36019.1 hypothetical protein CKF59_03085 [Psittacicella gerlachiana]
MELRYLSELPLSHFSKKLQALEQKLPENTVALIQINHPEITQAQVNNLLSKTLKPNYFGSQEITFTWLASQQLNIKKLFPVSSLQEFVFVLIEKKLTTELNLKFFNAPSSVEALNQIQELSKIYEINFTYFSDTDITKYFAQINQITYHLGNNSKQLLEQQRSPYTIYSDNNLPVTDLIPPAVINSLLSKKTLNTKAVDPYFIALTALQLNRNLSYVEQRAIQHASENLAFVHNMFWQNTPLSFNPNKAQASITEQALKLNLNDLSFTIETRELEKKHPPLEDTSYLNLETKHNLAQTIILKQHLDPQLQVSSQLIKEEYQEYLQQQLKRINLLEQAVYIDTYAQYLGYQTHLARNYYLEPKKNQVSKQKHENPERKRGTQTQNNFDQQIFEHLETTSSLPLCEQPTLTLINEKLSKLETNVQRSLRPNIPLLHLVISAIVNDSSEFSLKIKASLPTISKMFNLFYLQKNNKHLKALDEQLSLESHDLVQQIYQAIGNALTGQEYTQDKSNSELEQVYQTLKHLDYKIEIGYQENKLVFTWDQYQLTVENLNSGMILTPTSLLLEGMPLAITYSSQGLSFTDSYLIADNLVLRKKLTVSSSISNQDNPKII